MLRARILCTMRKNVTISADEELLRRAREVARRQGKSLNAMIRAYLEILVANQERGSAAAELVELFRTTGGDSGGRRIRRDEAYEDRT